MAEISGGEYIAQALRAEGVDTAFGIVDGTYLGLLSGMKKHGIRIIGPRHETSAAHMAGAYARLTGRMGVAFASNGPGVANLLPGVAVENAEGNRVLVLTSSRRTGITYPERGGTYQYFDQVATIQAMSKWSASAQSFERIPELFRTALRHLFSGRPGVVHLDVPENLINGKAEFPKPQKPFQYRSAAPISPSEEAIEKAAEILMQSRLPLIHAGSGVIHARAFSELKDLAEILAAPVTTSWAARGVLDERHPLAFPMVHVELYHKLRKEADSVLILGSRIGETDWWGKEPYWKNPLRQRTIQVDIDENILGRNKPAELLVCANVKVFLQKLNAFLGSQKKKISAKKRKPLLDKYKTLQKKDRSKLDKELKSPRKKATGEPLHPARVVDACRKHFSDDAIVVFDGGNTSVWGNFYTEIRSPGSVLSTFKFGMLGAGMAQALGAAVAFPKREVYCLIGDGAFGFHPQEVETAIRNKLKVVYIVFVDKQWGMVKMTQQFAFRPLKTMLFKELREDETINADFAEIRYDLLGESMGARGFFVNSDEELITALDEASSERRTSVLHVNVNNVKHMWAPGLLHFKAMHQEPGT